MLIRYKTQCVNLNIISFLTKYKKFDSYHICFMSGKYEETYEETRWFTFETEQERDKVFNYILDTYFTDIEQEVNKLGGI